MVAGGLGADDVAMTRVVARAIIGGALFVAGCFGSSNENGATKIVVVSDEENAQTGDLVLERIDLDQPFAEASPALGKELEKRGFKSTPRDAGRARWTAGVEEGRTVRVDARAEGAKTIVNLVWPIKSEAAAKLAMETRARLKTLPAQAASAVPSSAPALPSDAGI